MDKSKVNEHIAVLKGELGFKRDFEDKDCVMFVKQVGDIKVDVQLYIDGKHRVSHFYRECMNTYPSLFITVNGMRQAIDYEFKRRTLEGDRNEYHTFDDELKEDAKRYEALNRNEREDRTRCKWCGEYNAPDALKECPRCWELRSRIEGDMNLALNIIVNADNKLFTGKDVRVNAALLFTRFKQLLKI